MILTGRGRRLKCGKEATLLASSVGGRQKFSLSHLDCRENFGPAKAESESDRMEQFLKNRKGRPLSETTVGQRVTLHSTRLEAADLELLTAMGVVDDCELEVCRQGEPCVVAVGTTRVGLSSRLARNIWVHDAGKFIKAAV